MKNIQKHHGNSYLTKKFEGRLGKIIKNGSGGDDQIFHRVNFEKTMLCGVRHVNISPDNQFFVVTSDSDRHPVIKVFNIHKGELNILHGHSKSVRNTKFIGKTFLLSGSWDRSAILWDLQTGKIVQKYVTPEQGRIPFVAADPMQEKIYVCNYTSDVNLIKHNSINVFELKTGKYIETLCGHGVVKGNQTICCCRSQSKFYSGSDDYNCFERDLITGQIIAELTPHFGSIKYICLNHDSTLLATATAQPDCAIRIFDTSTNKLIGIIDNAFTDDVTSVHFVEKKGILVASSFDASAKAFDLQNFQEKKCYYGHDRDLWLCCLGFEQEVLVTGSLDGSCCFFDIDSQELIVRYYLLANNNYKDFLWVAPPSENYPNGEFYCSNPEFIYVYRKGKSLDSPEVPVTEDEFQKYYAEHNNSSLLNRLAHYSYYRNQLGKNGLNKPGFDNLQLPEHS